jgi:hypothetical protein
MMDYVLITVDYNGQKAVLELPVTVPLFNLIPLLMQQLSWGEGQDLSQFGGQVEGASAIRPHETLAQADVADGTILKLFAYRGDRMDPNATMLQVVDSDYKGKAHLKSRDTGDTFLFRRRAVLIGRSPECPINLSPVPRAHVVSGRHANIVRRGDTYWITDEDSTNGTIVDGIFLTAHQSIPLRNGSQIQFGETGPVFVFYSGEELQTSGQ